MEKAMQKGMDKKSLERVKAVFEKMKAIAELSDEDFEIASLKIGLECKLNPAEKCLLRRLMCDDPEIDAHLDPDAYEDPEPLFMRHSKTTMQ